MKREKPAKEPQVALRKREPRKPQEAELQMTMTPMIDCVFQLIIFFMIQIACREPKDGGEDVK
jgi:biopolymer transport protein ExbD